MKINRFYFILVIFIIFSNCAKPTVVSVKMPGDSNLNCEDLKNEYHETRRFKEEAIFAKNAGGNTARAMLFWPALLKTMHNADVAIKAANDRAYHVLEIMKKKNCKAADKLFLELTKTSSLKISDEIIKLNTLYKKGILSKEEFEQAKKKILE